MYFNNSNLTRFMTILTLESLNMLPSSSLFVFIFAIITYCLILLFQLMLILAVVVKRDLHKPMYILLFNLSICDLTGTTAFYPQLIDSALSESRNISYPACALQAFLIHVYAIGSLLILSLMAYDRYIAICKPLRYHDLMSQNILVKLIFMAWTINFAITGSLSVFTISKTICRTNLMDTFCNNPTLMKLTCEDTRAINYYALFTIILVQGASILIVLLTYITILMSCLSTKQTHSISKAIQTCGTHLVVFLSFEINALLLLISHRFGAVSPLLQKAFGVSVLIFPPLLNPLIYGLKTRKIRKTIFSFLPKKVSSI